MGGRLREVTEVRRCRVGCEVGEVLGWEERDCEIPGKMCEETGNMMGCSVFR